MAKKAMVNSWNTIWNKYSYTDSTDRKQSSSQDCMDQTDKERARNDTITITVSKHSDSLQLLDNGKACTHVSNVWKGTSVF